MGSVFFVHGIDSNQRAVFFGSAGDTNWVTQQLEASLTNYRHHSQDIRDRKGILSLFKELKPAAIIHAAGQPSHDLAARIPFDDFDTNAGGTLNLLEAARQACPEAPFIFMSTSMRSLLSMTAAATVPGFYCLSCKSAYPNLNQSKTAACTASAGRSSADWTL